MTVIASDLWSPLEYCLVVAEDAATRFVRVGSDVYDRVCRTGFDAPGFCLIDLGASSSSEALRRGIVTLKGSMQAVHQARTGGDLVFLSAARFDQQVTTKLHRDGGPEECFLMLGYEPSQVRAEVSLADYSKCAFDMGLTPAEFLEKHNPMYLHGEQLLRAYSTTVRCFSSHHCQILLINNSIAPHSEGVGKWQGVLHTATVRNPTESLRRVVNSAMVAAVPSGGPEPVSERELDEFLKTTAVRRRGNDRPDLEDDP